MTIISVSLNDNMLEDIQKIQYEQGYSGRSEVIRAGLRLLLSESKNTATISGDINAILMVIHSHDDEPTVSEIKHQFEEVTKTQIHSHLRENKCMEIFVLEGESSIIKEMVRLFQTSKKMDLIKLIVA